MIVGNAFFAADATTLQRISPKMQRVLIVDQQAAGPRLLTELLRGIAPCQAWTATDSEQGLALARRIDPHLIFVEHNPFLDGAGFTRTLRRGHLACRKAPVIMVTAQATAAAIVAARDAGVHEFLRRPYALGDLVRRIEAVTLRSRAWVEGVGYVGPDRRRFNSGDYSGPLKRCADNPATPDIARISQALKIFRASLFMVETDPEQALRSMRAQMAELQSAASAMADAELFEAAAGVEQSLARAHPATLRRRDLESHLAALWPFLPSENDSVAVAA